MRLLKTVLYLFLASYFYSCSEAYIPRPYGYFRVDLPAHEYRMVDTLDLPYRFELPKNVKLIGHSKGADRFSIDLHYEKLNANIFCSYMPIKGNLVNLLEDSRKFVYKHSIRADGISEKAFQNKERNVHGLLYDLKGNTASSVQFLVTDSAHHFFRGALYFNNVPNKDSITPMSNYIREDVIRIMETFEWKN
jgi:gliding motility-associated lipoprotein GldD